VGDDANDDIGVVFDLEIKTPSLVDAGLPEVLGFVILFGVQRWMEQAGG